MMMIRTAICDDERGGRSSIRSALRAFDDIEVVAECENGVDAVAAIRDMEPDLVFLDVNMPGLDGFEVIETVGPDRMPGVIFVTAHDEHAIDAFAVHAFDYLLKPLDEDRFAEGLQEARRRLEMDRGALGQRYRSLLRDVHAADSPSIADGVPEGEGPVSRILVREKEKARFVDVADLERITAAGNYARLHMRDGSTALIRASIGALAERLDPARFVRIHRSSIVNVDCIEEVRPWSGGDYTAVLRTGEELRVSRTYSKDLLRPMF